jgi:hypothetical protein
MAINLENEILNVIDYKDSSRFKKLKADIWKLASDGKPYTIGADATATEYRYFHKLYLLYVGMVKGEISKEKAQDEDRSNYMKFELDQRVWERYQFAMMEFNDNIRKSESARVKINQSENRADIVDAVIECIEATTGDKTMRAKLETLKDGDKT